VPEIVTPQVQLIAWTEFRPPDGVLGTVRLFLARGGRAQHA